LETDEAVMIDTSDFTTEDLRSRENAKRVFRDYVAELGVVETSAIVVELVRHMTPAATVQLAKQLAHAERAALPTLADLGLPADRALVRGAVERGDIEGTAAALVEALPPCARYRLIVELLAHFILEH
jgi:hypothetical protein